MRKKPFYCLSYFANSRLKDENGESVKNLERSLKQSIRIVKGQNIFETKYLFKVKLVTGGSNQI